MDNMETRLPDKSEPYHRTNDKANQGIAKEELKMTNAELMNKVMTEDELNIVAGGGPRVRVPLRGPSFKQIKDVTGAIHNAKKVITCLIKKFSPNDQVLRQYPAPTNPLTDEMRKIDKLVMGV